MFRNWRSRATAEERLNADFRAQAQAVDKSHAVIEFGIDGSIRSANENFLRVMGYTLDEIRGKHHRSFVDPAYAQSPEYVKFWLDLKAGRHLTGEFARVAKGGREVWLQASYSPILDPDGKPYKIVKFALDVTEQKQQSARNLSELAAIDRSTGVIHFELDGTIVDANENFLRSVDTGWANCKAAIIPCSSTKPPPAAGNIVNFGTSWQRNVCRGCLPADRKRRPHHLAAG
jgi:methyl-accepting chemotaxis protein